jgi:hypothetical protein
LDAERFRPYAAAASDRHSGVKSVFGAQIPLTLAKFELVINSKTANALGIDATLLARSAISRVHAKKAPR